MELKLEEREDGRLLATFAGKLDDVPRALCDELVAAIRDDSPRSIQLMCDFGIPGSAWPDALAGVTLPSLEAFIFDVYFQTQTRQGHNTVGNLAATLTACPNLQRLFASGMSDLSPVTHDKQVALHLLGDPLPPQLVENLAACRFDSLERIVLSLASDHGPADGGAAVTSLVAMHAPALKQVTISDADSLTALLGQLAAAPRPWDLTLGGSIDDEDELLSLIEEHAEALRTFTALALPFADYTSTDAFERAQQLVPSITEASYSDSGTLPDTYKRW